MALGFGWTRFTVFIQKGFSRRISCVLLDKLYTKSQFVWWIFLWLELILIASSSVYQVWFWNCNFFAPRVWGNMNIISVAKQDQTTRTRISFSETKEDVLSCKFCSPPIWNWISEFKGKLTNGSIVCQFTENSTAAIQLCVRELVSHSPAVTKIGLRIRDFQM